MKNVPEIRIAGYDDTWEQGKLGDLVLIERGGSPRPIDAFITDSSDGLNWVKIGDAPEQGRYITKTAEKIKPEGRSKTREVKPGDLILSNSMTFGKPYIMAINGCIHDGWLLIRDIQHKFDLKFLCHLLGSENMLKQYKSLAAGSTVNNLNKELVGNTHVIIPSLKEQKIIGQYFENLDNLLTLHQRKYEKLKATKAALLQKMFPKEGDTVPELRFEGFSDDWEQRKLGDVSEFIRNGYSYKADDDRSHEFKVTRIESISNGVISKEKLGSTTSISQDYLLRDGDILFSHLNSLPYIGNSAIYTNELGTIYHGMNLLNIRPQKNKVDQFFLLYLIKKESSRNWFRSIAKPAVSQCSISSTEVGEFVFYAPSLDEQKKLGEVFTSLDNLLTLHQRECEKLQDVKKALLAKMFPGGEN